MIEIIDKVDCCGCNACGDICAQKAITFKNDEEGFGYPEINNELCTDCHLCEKICPILNIKELKKMTTKSHYVMLHKLKIWSRCLIVLPVVLLQH